jgi:hypothetical protein
MHVRGPAGVSRMALSAPMPCNRGSRRTVGWLGWSDTFNATMPSSHERCPARAARKLNHPLLTSYYFINLNAGAGHAWRTSAPVTRCGSDLFQAAPGANRLPLARQANVAQLSMVSPAFPAADERLALRLDYLLRLGVGHLLVMMIHSRISSSSLTYSLSSLLQFAMERGQQIPGIVVQLLCRNIPFPLLLVCSSISSPFVPLRLEPQRLPAPRALLPTRPG